MSSALHSDALNQLFVTARTHYEWTDVPVERCVVRALYDLLKWGLYIGQLLSGTVRVGNKCGR